MARVYPHSLSRVPLYSLPLNKSLLGIYLMESCESFQILDLMNSYTPDLRVTKSDAHRSKTSNTVGEVSRAHIREWWQQWKTGEYKPHLKEPASAAL
jgi:hypothetical protein